MHADLEMRPASCFFCCLLIVDQRGIPSRSRSHGTMNMNTGSESDKTKMIVIFILITEPSRSLRALFSFEITFKLVKRILVGTIVCECTQDPLSLSCLLSLCF